jgi:biotin carboxyl carrier protein
MKVNVQIENQVYQVEIEDLNARPILATVNGETVAVMPEADNVTAAVPAAAPVVSAAPTPAAPAPAPKPVSSASGQVLAPIPGVVEEIKVHEGDSVKSGQELLVLEAMKMKNSIRASRDGKVNRILVAVGQQVPHNHLLIEITD